LSVVAASRSLAERCAAFTSWHYAFSLLQVRRQRKQQTLQYRISVVRERRRN